jgi:hypothetical protein
MRKKGSNKKQVRRDDLLFAVSTFDNFAFDLNDMGIEGDAVIDNCNISFIEREFHIVVFGNIGRRSVLKHLRGAAAEIQRSLLVKMFKDAQWQYVFDWSWSDTGKLDT